MNNQIGLTTEQVDQRIKEGKVNTSSQRITRSYKDIFKSNVFTFFNFINIVLFAMVLLVRSPKNGLFLGTVIFNVFVGVFQEIKAKKTLDKLSILTVNKVDVIRDGKRITIAVDALVLDDVMLLKEGMQIPADAEVVDGHIEVNESLLTGESVPQVKEKDDSLFSGSLVTAGEAYCKVVHVGKDNYSEKLSEEAKKYKRHVSELRNSLDTLIKIVSGAIIPLGIILVVVQRFLLDMTIQNTVVKTVAALVGMIPEGLVVLTSVALAISVLRLSKMQTLVQELYCIETLARVDTLCLDKTGTITEGSMKVRTVEALDDTNVDEAMGNFVRVFDKGNATNAALHEYFKEDATYHELKTIPFSSDRKFSAVNYEKEHSYYLGAVQFLFPNSHEELKKKCQTYASEGSRVVILAHSFSDFKESELLDDLQPCAIIAISDSIRASASKTIQYFMEQGVDLKVISGDDPVTVSAIAKKVGLPNADSYIDFETIHTEDQMREAMNTHAVFGRVKPQQKKAMVSLLQESGHCVAMTGDGVNDVPALKKANVSVAMASGSDAAKNTANIVLLNSDFSSLPYVVKEGRRVINNINRAASMFLVKTVFSFLLVLMVVLFGQSYPFQPIHLTIISAFAVGIPTFLLQNEPSFERVTGRFLSKAFKNAIPSALAVFLSAVVCMITQNIFHFSIGVHNSMMIILTGFIYIYTLLRVYTPLTNYRKLVFSMMLCGFIISIIVLRNLLNLSIPTLPTIAIVAVEMMIVPWYIQWMSRLYDSQESKVLSFVQKIVHK